MFNFGTQELILVLIIALVVFGPGKLPEVGKAIGKSINEFKGAVSGDKSEKKVETKTVEAKEEDVRPTASLKKTIHVDTAKSDDEKEV